MYEQHRLFFGDAECEINISSIRILETNQNYQSLIQTICCFDNIISGKITANNRISSSFGYGKLLSDLFDYILHGKKTKKWNQYVFETFNCFVKNKTKIKIYIDRVLECVEDEALLNLMFYRSQKNDNTRSNGCLIKQEIFEMCTNVEQIIIFSDDYPFSLVAYNSFLSIIGKTKLNKVTVVCKDGGWLSHFWIHCSDLIVRKFGEKMCKVEFDGDNELTIMLDSKRFYDYFDSNLTDEGILINSDRSIAI